MTWNGTVAKVDDLLRIRAKWKRPRTPTWVILTYFSVILRCAANEKAPWLLEALGNWIDTIEWLLPWLVFKVIFFIFVSNLPFWVAILFTIAFVVWGFVEYRRYKSLEYNKDTKQIVTPETFISEYERDKYSTPLSTPFQHRENELDLGIQALQECGIVLIKGAAGVGKTKLALQIQNTFCDQNRSFIPLCVVNKGGELHQDLRRLLDDDKEYVLLLDDVNRMENHLQTVVSLLREERQGSIKLLLTVREYVKEATIQTVADFAYKEIHVISFSDKQIEKLLRAEPFEIKNPSIISHIVGVVQGNARLAIMAATSIKKNNALIFDKISQIYEEYYRELYVSLSSKNGRTTQNALALIAFFQVINKENLSESVVQSLELTKDEFWNEMVYFDRLEIVDLYEGSVKFADQTFATYILYNQIVVNKQLRFNSLLNLFPTYNTRLKEVVYAICRSFGFDTVRNVIEPSILECWQSHKIGVNSREYIETFWPLMPHEALAYIKDHIPNEIVETVLRDEELFNNQSEISRENKDLSILTTMLQQYETRWHKTVIDILLSLLNTIQNPLESSEKIIKAITFTNVDHNFGYRLQNIYVDTCIEQYNRNPTGLLRQHIIQLCNYFLNIAFEYSPGVNRDNAYTIHNIHMVESVRGRELRNKLIQWFITNIKDLNTIKKFVLRYSNQRVYRVDNEITNTILIHDAEQLLPHLSATFNPERIEDQYVMMNYIAFLQHNTDIDLKQIADTFGKGFYELYKVSDSFFLLDGTRRLIKEKERFTVLKNQEVLQHFESLGVKNYIRNVKELISVPFEENLTNRIANHTRNLLVILAEQDRFDEVTAIVEEVVSDEEISYTFRSFCMAYLKIAFQTQVDTKRFYSMLESCTPQWKIAFFSLLSKEEVNEFEKEIESFFESNSGSIIVEDLSFLLNLNNSKGIKILSEVIKSAQKSEWDIHFGYNCINDNFEDLQHSPEILRYIYDIQQQTQAFCDYDGTQLEKVFSIDPEYIVERFLSYIETPVFHYREFPNHSYKFLWNSKEGRETIYGLIEKSVEKPVYGIDRDHPIGLLFKPDNEEERKEREGILKEFVASHTDSENALLLACSIYKEVGEEENGYLQFLAYVIEAAPQYDIIKHIEPKSMTWSGSRVPILENRIGRYMKLRSHLERSIESSKLLAHINKINDKIRELKLRIQREKRLDFEEN